MGTEENGNGRRQSGLTNHEADIEEEEEMEMEEMNQMSYRRKKSKKETMEEGKEEEETMPIEKVFEGKQVPTWREQLTFRSMVVAAFFSVMFNFIVMKRNLTTGVIPSLNIGAGLLGFFFARLWTKALEMTGCLRQPFTRQENAVIQTCVVASSGIAFCGMYPVIKQLTCKRRRIIHSFAQEIQPEPCITALPSLGLKAYNNTFYFDFSAAYVGVGMMCPYIVNISILLGAILSWGIMWPLIGKKEGSWYPLNLDSSDLHGLQGYRVFIGIALILGDSLYNFIKVLSRIIFSSLSTVRSKGSRSTLAILDDDRPTTTTSSMSFNNRRRTEFFMKDQISKSIAYVGYVAIAAISIATLPHIFHQPKWYHVLVAYTFAPVLAFCINAYGCALTDWSLASAYGKLGILIIGAWVGASNGGVIAGLAACGVMIMSIVSTASDLMQDFKTGYLTLASSRSMFVSQLIGTAMGCVIAPCVFWLFYKAFNDLGFPRCEYPAPCASIYRGITILGVDDFSSLPKHCLTFCYIFFAAAALVNLVRDFSGKKVARFIPLPMAMAIPFYLGEYLAIDMCVGSLILFVWERKNKAQADAFGPVVASVLIFVRLKIGWVSR